MVKAKKRNKKTKWKKEEIKLSLRTNEMIIYVENTKKPYQKATKTIKLDYNNFTVQGQNRTL